MLAALASVGCSSRPLPGAAGPRDAGGDGTDALGEAGPDVRADGPGRDTSTDGAGRDAPADAPAAICPAGVAPVDVCGCGCCGPPQTTTCYYPANGESANSIPNPVPASCANVGCSSGVRHLCCLDPGRGPASNICVGDKSIEDLLRYVIVSRDGAVCTTLELRFNVPAQLPIRSNSGWSAQFGSRGPCDGSSPAAPAIGAAGILTVAAQGLGSGVELVGIHAALFFDDGDGTATPVRLDADSVAVQTTTPCP
jgi:hypothetical protein